MGMRKRVALDGNLCLRGKMGRVGRRTLMVLSMVSPIVVLWDGLRSAPDNERGEKTAFRCHLPDGAYLGFDLSLPCFEL